jgi:L-iditol 2-dehydrogenase
MKAIVTEDAYRWVLEDLPEPEPSDGEVLLEVKACGICGSDLHDFKVKSKRRIPGHEASGVLLKGGERVVLNPVLDCGRCKWCKMGLPNLCPEFRGVIGCQYDGGFSERLKAPEGNFMPLPEGMSFEEATLCDSLAVALNGIALVDLSLVEDIAVFGLGAVGMSLALALDDMGYRVTTVDIKETKLKLARELGFHVVDGRGNILKELREGKLDLCVDAVGNPDIVNLSLRLLRKGGTFLAVGVSERPVTPD